MKLVRKQTYLTKEQDRLIKQLSRTQGLSEAEIVRKAVNHYLETRGAGSSRDALWDVVGIANSGAKNGSTAHDDIYIE